MKLYFRFDQIPEIKSLPHDLRQKRLRDAYSQSSRHWQVWAGMGIAMVVACAGGMLSVAITEGIAAATIGGGLAGGLGMFIYIQILVRTMMPYLKDGTESIF